jgi:hypothetical protein
VVVDLYADVHFGCVEHAGRFVTRNHMAFASLAEEVVPGLVEVEVAVPRSRPAVW